MTDHTTIILFGIGTILNAGAAVAAWIAKIRWSTEFREAKNAQLIAKDATIETLRTHIAGTSAAKDETLRAKDAQVAMLRDQLDHLSSPAVRTYVREQKQLLEDINVEQASKIAAGERQLNESAAVVRRMEKELNIVKQQRDEFKANLDKLRNRPADDSGSYRSFLQDIASSSAALMNSVVANSSFRLSDDIDKLLSDYSDPPLFRVTPSSDNQDDKDKS